MGQAEPIDLCILGAGCGGVELAFGAARLGRKVVIIERDKLGGAALNVVAPLTALAAAAKEANALRKPRIFEPASGSELASLRTAVEHARTVVASQAADASAERLAGAGVELIRGAARFADRKTVVVGEKRIAARHFVIATGSRPSPLAIVGLESTPHLTESTLFATPQRITKALIIGASAAALTLAQTLQRLGASATLIALGPLLPDFDRELVRPLLDRIGAEGAMIVEGAAVERVEASPSGGVRLHASRDGARDQIDGSHLIVFPAREPAIADLNLAAAGVKHDASGVTVSAGLRTSNAAISALGDAIPGPWSAALAKHHADCLLRRLALGSDVDASPLSIARLALADPELAQVGLTEAEARARHGGQVAALRWPFSQNDRAVAERRTEGFVKVVAGKGGRVLGAAILGASAGELIQTWSLAIAHNLTVADVARSSPPYPTFAESSVLAARGVAYLAEPAGARRGKLFRLPRLG